MMKFFCKNDHQPRKTTLKDFSPLKFLGKILRLMTGEVTKKKTENVFLNKKTFVDNI